MTNDAPITTAASRVFEPNAEPCNATASWSVSLLRDELSGTFQIVIEFTTRDDQTAQCRISAADRSQPERIRKILDANNARLPHDKNAAALFVLELLRAIPVNGANLTYKPGWRFCATGFVMPWRNYGTAENEFVWDHQKEAGNFAARSGNLADYTVAVLIPAKQSPQLTVAVLIALASPLLNYVSARLRRPLSSETAIFHWAGANSSGKTTLLRVTQSVIGAPGEYADYRASERGAAEEAYKRNDLVAVFDEAEHQDMSERDVLDKMNMLGKVIPSGRSKAISRAVRNALPDLSWSCLAVSTGPETQADVARRLGKSRFGQQARFLDIGVPHHDRGGIFEARWAADAPSRLTPEQQVHGVEAGIIRNHGVLFDAWIRFLLEHDVSRRAAKLTQDFVELVAAHGEALDRRVARKFGALYAAGMIGVEEGKLPWTLEWVRRAVVHCYFVARAIRDPDLREVEMAARSLVALFKDRNRFPLVSASGKGVPEFVLPEHSIGFVVARDGAKKGFLIPDRLTQLGLTSPALQKRFISKILKVGDANHGNVPTQQFRVRDQLGNRIRVRAHHFTPSAVRQAAGI